MTMNRTCRRCGAEGEPRTYRLYLAGVANLAVPETIEMELCPRCAAAYRACADAPFPGPFDARGGAHAGLGERLYRIEPAHGEVDA